MELDGVKELRRLDRKSADSGLWSVDRKSKDNCKRE
jgi:hypothetical protein